MRTALLAAATFVFAFSGAAFSPAHAEANVAAVQHADLNLSNEADAKVLLKRIDRAAAQMCKSAAPSQFQACKKDVAEHTIVALDNIVVSAMYAGEPPAKKITGAAAHI